MKLFDAHAHLQLELYDQDREAVLARMQEKEMGAIIVGVDLATSKAAIALAEQHSFLWAAVGLHPNDNPEEEFDAVAYGELAKHTKVVAIGECGLDFYRRDPTQEEMERQTVRFQKHMEIAIASRKPLIIHCRPTQQTDNAHEKMLAFLRPHMERGDLQAVIHFFTASAAIAQRYLTLGCYLSFPGPITYTDMYDASIEVAPTEKILSETDAPFAAPVPHRGKRNEPSYVAYTVEKIAVVKGYAPKDMGARIAQNAEVIFSLR